MRGEGIRPWPKSSKNSSSTVLRSSPVASYLDLCIYYTICFTHTAPASYQRLEIERAGIRVRLYSTFEGLLRTSYACLIRENLSTSPPLSGWSRVTRFRKALLICDEPLRSAIGYQTGRCAVQRHRTSLSLAVRDKPRSAYRLGTAFPMRERTMYFAQEVQTQAGQVFRTRNRQAAILTPVSASDTQTAAGCCSY